MRKQILVMAFLLAAGIELTEIRFRSDTPQACQPREVPHTADQFQVLVTAVECACLEC